MQVQLPSDLIDILIKNGEDIKSNAKALTNDAVPIGAEFVWPASTSLLPFNYRVCDGALIDRIGYAALFQLLGTTHGVGDGSTTFAIPNRSVYLNTTDPEICKIYQSGAQAAPTTGTWTLITFNTTIFNYGGFTVASNKITVPTTGMYRALGMLATTANSQTFVGALVYNNSGAGTGHTFPDGTIVEAYTGATDSNGVSFPVLSMEGVFELAAGSTIGMEWYQATAGTTGGVAGRNMLTVERLDKTIDTIQNMIIKVL